MKNPNTPGEPVAVRFRGRKNWTWMLLANAAGLGSLWLNSHPFATVLPDALSVLAVADVAANRGGA